MLHDVWSMLVSLILLTPFLPWAAACAAAMVAEGLAGRRIPWRDRRLNLIAGGWVLLGIAAIMPLLGGALVAIQHALHMQHAPVVLDRGYPGASVLGALAWMAIYDVGYYAFHRAEHRVPWLWRIHAVHHSDPAMNATTYVRQHVLESALQSFVLLLPMLLVFRMSPASAMMVSLLGAGLQFWIHADVPVHYGRAAWLLCSPMQHRIHHTRDVRVGERNFASTFPWIDRLFGTYTPAIAGERTATGLFDGTTWACARDLWVASPRDRQPVASVLAPSARPSIGMDAPLVS